MRHTPRLPHVFWFLHPTARQNSPYLDYHHHISKRPAVTVDTQQTGGVNFCPHTHTVETDEIIGDGVTPLVFPLCLWTFATWLLQAATCYHNAGGNYVWGRRGTELLIKQYPWMSRTPKLFLRRTNLRRCRSVGDDSTLQQSTRIYSDTFIVTVQSAILFVFTANANLEAGQLKFTSSSRY